MLNVALCPSIRRARATLRRRARPRSTRRGKRSKPAHCHPSEPVGASKSLHGPRRGRRAEAYSMYAEHAARRPGPRSRLDGSDCRTRTYDPAVNSADEPSALSMVASTCSAEASESSDPAHPCFPMLSDDSTRRDMGLGVQRIDRSDRAEPAAGSQAGPEVESTRTPAPTADAVEVALARAIEGATVDRQWALAAQLAGELEARRRARANVPTLHAELARQRRT